MYWCSNGQLLPLNITQSIHIVYHSIKKERYFTPVLRCAGYARALIDSPAFEHTLPITASVPDTAVPQLYRRTWLKIRSLDA